MRLRQDQPRTSEHTLWRHGFTLVEVLAGISILGLVAGVIIFGLSQLNYFASVNRLYTAAHTLAQNQIDLVLTKAPYNPVLDQFPTPNVLQSGTYYSDPSTPNTLYGSVRNVPIYYYNDTSGTQVNVVMGSIKTTVTEPAVSVGGTNLYIKQATVTVTYTFRNKTFSVKMDTMRISDV